MHICHITSMHPWFDDRIYERACRMLVRLGHHVTLIVTEGQGLDAVTDVRAIALKARPHGLKRRLLSSREALQQARRLDADIYHFHDPDLLPWMRRLAAEGRPVVYDVHENFVARFGMWGLPASIASLAGRLFRAYERDCVSHFAGVVTVSNTVLSFFDGVRRDGCVVQNVPDADRFAEVGSFADRPGPPVIYTSGTHSDARNCLPTIEAMPRVLERHSDARFVFVGRYHPEGYQDQLRERAQALGVEASLTLGGLIPWEDNFRRTEQAHIGCVFYADNPNNRVTIPNRIFEYMLCGVAVLAHDFPELARIVQGSRCGLLVDSAQGRSIADGVIALLDHRDELAECGQNGRRAVFERYNFRAQCLGMTAMYERILGVKT